eukprot:SAG31_NODE_39174_length_290_cov_1.005236_1_plen_22_part_01
MVTIFGTLGHAGPMALPERMQN